MSAFLTSPQTPAILARAISERKISTLPEVAIAAALAAANVASVLYRYRGEWPGHEEHVPAVVEASLNPTVEIGQIAADEARLRTRAECFDYQSCERPDWTVSTVCGWIGELLDQLPEAPSTDGDWT
jgi:hypothetical protein